MNESLSIHFLLKENIAEESVRAEEIRACMQTGRPGLCFLAECVGDNAESVERAVGEEGDTPCLYVTDSGRIYRELVRLARPAVGYLHGGNQGETFPGAGFLVEDPQEIDADSWEKIRQRLIGEPWTIAVTEHLLIREMVPEDLDSLYVLYEDPQARKFLDPPGENREEEARILRAYIEKVYHLFGYGMWAVCCRSTGEMIGRVGFAPCESGQTAELGYLIRADLRGQGLAAEAAAAALRFAGGDIGFSKAGAHTSADNAASIALLRKLGFKEVDDAASGNLLYFEKELDHCRDEAQ